jgi:hypothetical protein
MKSREISPARRAAFLITATLIIVGSARAIAATTTNWALQPLVCPQVPGVAPRTSRSIAPLNPIDAFIQARLAASKLTPSPEADRRTLIRRLHFDLIGLPPTSEAVRAFEQDRSPDAYAQLVETLLNSPRYGERWARHWLDAVRFAETTGFEVNTPRPNAWPYRDYVIAAFNSDKPYDQFILEQLAGDALGADAATGFLVAGPDDKVKSPDPVLTSNQRADELHDMVSTTASAFLGLTVGCARCHDHKFDPIPQADYYALKAIFEGVQHGERQLRTADTAAKDQELTAHRQRLERIDARLAELEPVARTQVIDTNELRAPVHPRQNVEHFEPIRARHLRFIINATTDAEPCIDELEVYTSESKPRNIALASAGAQTSASGVYPNSEIHRLEHLNDGKVGNSHSWISNERGKGWVQIDFPQTMTISRVKWGRDREQKFSDRLAVDYRIEVAAGSNDWRLVAGSVDREPFRPGARPRSSFHPAGLPPAALAECKALSAERTDLENRINELSKGTSFYGGTFVAQPPPTHRLHRGDPMQPRDTILPGALSAVSLRFEASGRTGDFSTLTDNQRRRLALARWIANPANPLTSRVLVNRLWQYHFGEGLVNTPSDFGANGARPTHPELLDWLACEFLGVESVSAKEPRDLRPAPRPWSIRHMHRLIVMSATYRQSSAIRADCMAMDAGSRLLWRYPPRRLEAEAIRDLILATSGKLDLRMGGPGFSFFEPNDNYVRVYAPRRDYGEDTWRRMIYGTVVRQRPDGVFGVFDCPDGGQIAPKRTRSTTPLQALNLLNSGFIQQQAGFLAERLRKENGPEPKAQVRGAFRLAFQREATRGEIEASLALVRAEGLALFCRALLNANELIYVD